MFIISLLLSVDALSLYGYACDEISTYKCTICKYLKAVRVTHKRVGSVAWRAESARVDPIVHDSEYEIGTEHNVLLITSPLSGLLLCKAFCSSTLDYSWKKNRVFLWCFSEAIYVCNIYCYMTPLLHWCINVIIVCGYNSCSFCLPISFCTRSSNNSCVDNCTRVTVSV